MRPARNIIVITDTDWSPPGPWSSPRVIDGRDNDNQQQPILSQQRPADLDDILDYDARKSIFMACLQKVGKEEKWNKYISWL